MIRLTCAVLSIGLLACGDDGGTNTPVDSPMTVATVMSVTCPATPNADVTVNAAGTAWDPATTTISVGQIVRFTTTLDHNLVPNPAAGMTDSGLTVGFNQEKCLQFTAAGTFNFKCNPHGFAGSVTVQ